MEEAEETANECGGAIAELTEENTDLKRRYEALIAELDRMVAEDYYLGEGGGEGGGEGVRAKVREEGREGGRKGGENMSYCVLCEM